jgi:hypothetical protein
MFQIEGMTLRVNFTQALVDWFNINYPERNFFTCAPTTIKPGDLTQKNFIRSEKYVMEDFIYGPELFFKHGSTEGYDDVPLQEDELKDFEKLLHALAQWFLKLEFDAGEQPNIFLNRLVGQLILLGDETYVHKITNKSLGAVGVEWTLYGVY